MMILTYLPLYSFLFFLARAIIQTIIEYPLSVALRVLCKGTYTENL